MLAQNFKTPAELKINDAEFSALVMLLGMLERQDLPGRLDLTLWIDERAAPCKTFGCLAGWAWHLSGHSAFVDVMGPNGNGLDRSADWKITRSDGLIDLFISYSRDPGDAPVALRNFLTHGEPRWDETMS